MKEPLKQMYPNHHFNDSDYHTFHIPVMGLAFTIDTPLKVARFGISSVVSIVEDSLIEGMREFLYKEHDIPYTPITKKEHDFRAKRITDYLNLLNSIVCSQIEKIKSEPFQSGNEILQYFQLLPDHSLLKKEFSRMMLLEDGEEKFSLQTLLRNHIKAGSIDVNIMTKLDKVNYDEHGELMPAEFSDAAAALRGFASSTLHSSVIFSAGMNPRLFSYCETLSDFLPDSTGNLKKKIILKVSDYRSAQIQGKFLAKKGLWVSEFRVESGLNCGGHAFATDGYLLGPILEEFKVKKKDLADELFNIWTHALSQKGIHSFSTCPEMKLSVQGGIGTANENQFLFDYYKVDYTGWGSPFLLVPEVTNLDDETLQQLSSAKKEDYFLSHASPLGVHFNNFKPSSAQQERIQRVIDERPGSPCYNKNLTFNTEFTEKPICTASREYQQLKINQLNSLDLSPEERISQIQMVTEKECICQGLSISVFLKNGVPAPHKLKAVSICPGPNLAYFSGVFTMKEMIDHIYGRTNLLNALPRPNFFINELNLYIDYLKSEIENCVETYSANQVKYIKSFKENLLSGIAYYKSLVPSMKRESDNYRQQFFESLLILENLLLELYASDENPKPHSIT